jgi:DNA-binding beta-propeller fold protein YncE
MTSGAEPSRGGWSRRRFFGTLAGTAAVVVVPAPASAPGDPESAPAADSTAAEAPAPGAHRPGKDSGPRPLYLGTYTSVDGGGTGIGLATYDASTGQITGTGALTGVADPSYLALHPDGRTLYAVDEQTAGAVTAVRLADRKILGARSTGGAGPCHLSVHPTGRWLLSANYTSGSVAVHPIDTSGALGDRTALVKHSSPQPGPGQDGPHAHQFVTSPDGGHVLAVDLGTDTVYTYRLDTTKGTLTEVSQAHTRAGAGPRSLTFHPGGRRPLHRRPAVQRQHGQHHQLPGADPGDVERCVRLSRQPRRQHPRPVRRRGGRRPAQAARHRAGVR